MTLSKQTKTNRENAKQSTGPIIEQGKEKNNAISKNEPILL